MSNILLDFGESHLTNFNDRCVNNGCVWNRNNGTCGTNDRSCKNITTQNICRREGCVWRNNRCNDPTSNPPGVTCTGANDRTGACGVNEFCYTKGNCSNNVRGECVSRPRTFSDCSRDGIFSTFSTTSGHGCASDRFYNSECQAAINGENMRRRKEEAETESLQQQETDADSEEEE